MILNLFESTISIYRIGSKMQIFPFSYDFLYVHDGTIRDRHLARLTGNPNDLKTLTTVSTGNSMTLHFVSDSSEGKGGFVLQYEACKNNTTLKISKYANPNTKNV